jgi:hypothetical protein
MTNNSMGSRTTSLVGTIGHISLICSGSQKEWHRMTNSDATSFLLSWLQPLAWCSFRMRRFLGGCFLLASR